VTQIIFDPNLQQSPPRRVFLLYPPGFPGKIGAGTAFS